MSTSDATSEVVNTGSVDERNISSISESEILGLRPGPLLIGEIADWLGVTYLFSQKN